MNILEGPKTPPIVQLIQWIADPIGFMESNAKLYGDIFQTQLGSKFSLVLIGDPKALQEIFRANAKQCDADVGIANESLPIVVGKNSILLTNSQRHKRKRKLLMPPFHGSRMVAYGELICHITQQIVSQWQIGQPFSVRSSTQVITMRVILQAVFGLYEGLRSWQLQQALEEWLNITASPIKSSPLYLRFLQQDWGAWSPWGHFLRCRQRVDDLLYTEIRERRENLDPTRTDILTLLMSAEDENGERMTDEELRDELITLLLAGHESTATSLAWALYWIHKLPDVKKKLRTELSSLGDRPNPEAIFRLPYLTAVCQETLRIYPVTPIAYSRVPTSSMEIGDYQFDAGTMLTPCIYLTHHREDLYPNPKKFRPERFLERQYSPYEYLPFGGGNRRCIGMALAQYEMKLAISTILQNLELALPDDRPVRPVRRGLTIAPSDNLRLVVTGRRTPNKTPAAATVG
ncbi:cytochrome P450 [Oscillatoriales cyanobacterium LEGE 11467]|uniref:Cytochrome P450 n=1 Tax=Zarconia navalis LEGE 11467 TaxID=1828826 RepID=A0A928VXW0_9CYAN|nr:cytochrome P450 [Zarconia navalis]MBE9041298.1 cytochrome P450 [Zarconia navalis LEGE 11467]